MELSEILSLNPLIQAWTAESPRSAATLPHTLFPLCALRVFCGEKESYGPVDSCSSYPVSCGDTPPVRFGGRAQGCRKAALAFLRVCPNPYQRLRRRPQPNTTAPCGVPRTAGRRPLAHQPASGPRTVEILDTEEKGSDVNLASYLLLDGFEDEYEMAVVVSNDSDLQLPISMTRTKLGKQVGVFDPSRKRSFELHSAASWYRPLHQGPLGASQFPDTLSDGEGLITKPAGW